MFPNWVLCHQQRISELNFFLILQPTCGRRFSLRGAARWSSHSKMLLEIPCLIHTLVNLDSVRHTQIMPNSLVPHGNIWLLEVFILLPLEWQRSVQTPVCSSQNRVWCLCLQRECKSVSLGIDMNCSLTSACLWAAGNQGFVVLRGAWVWVPTLAQNSLFSSLPKRWLSLTAGQNDRRAESRAVETCILGLGISCWNTSSSKTRAGLAQERCWTLWVPHGHPWKAEFLWECGRDRWSGGRWRPRTPSAAPGPGSASPVLLPRTSRGMDGSGNLILQQQAVHQSDTRPLLRALPKLWGGCLQCCWHGQTSTAGFRG